MSDADYKPIRPFDIDNGELTGLSQQECFVLGYELAMVDAQIASGEAFERPIHADNSGRIRAELMRRNRRFTIRWAEDDISESWANLRVFSK